MASIDSPLLNPKVVQLTKNHLQVSPELHEAFTTFTSDSSLFCLPVTITSESLTPLKSIRYPSSHSGLFNSIHTLSDIVTPTTPLYLLLRRAPSTSELLAITYIPSRAPVRQKTLFASTRATLVRDLGSEKFAETIFLTEREEVLDPAQWDERSGSAAKGASAQNASDPGVDIGLLSMEERELQAVKRAEEEERHGTRGRDLMGEGGSGGSYIGSREGQAAGRSGVMMKITDDARSALAELKTPGTEQIVQLAIDPPTETLTLLFSKADVAPGAVPGLIPGDRPSYTFYNAKDVPGSIFMYVCPGSSKIKERMLHASARLGVLKIVGSEGVEVLKKLEAGDPDELGGGRLEDEVKALAAAAGVAGGLGGEGDNEDSAPASGTATPRSGFARPKRPGKR